MKKIAIIGSGIAGLTLANRLKKIADIDLFEKARGVGGRMSTRYAHPYQFDHGAQYFTARNKKFKKFLAPLIESGLVENWQPKITTLEKNKKPYQRLWFEDHFVACPKMNSLCHHLAQDLNLEVATRVTKLIQSQKGWKIEVLKPDQSTELRDKTYDWIFSTAPANQTKNLFPAGFSRAKFFDRVEMMSCFSLMIGYQGKLPFSWDAAVVKNSPINWIVVNSTKPKRASETALLIQTDNHWSNQHIDDDRAEIEKLLLAETIEITGIDQKEIAYCSLHGWRYSALKNAAKKDYLLDQKLKLAAFGDWCIAGRVEAAFLSANRLAKKIKSIVE